MVVGYVTWCIVDQSVVSQHLTVPHGQRAPACLSSCILTWIRGIMDSFLVCLMQHHIDAVTGWGEYSLHRAGTRQQPWETCIERPSDWQDCGEINEPPMQGNGAFLE